MLVKCLHDFLSEIPFCEPGMNIFRDIFDDTLVQWLQHWFIAVALAVDSSMPANSKNSLIGHKFLIDQLSVACVNGLL